MTTEPESATTYYPVKIGDTEVQLQLALNDPERTQGLMHRDSMPKEHGMLFLFEKPEPRSFWMRNTRIPLDLGYFDADGRLKEVHALYPYDETPVKSYSRDILIAVEMNQGWYSAHGIKPGAQIDLSALTEAVSRRGQSPATFQLSELP